MYRLIASLSLLTLPIVALAEPVEVEFVILDKATGQPIPCRVHLKDAAGKPVKAPGLPFWFDHFVCPGSVQLPLEPGKYTIEVERGPEYGRVTDAVEIKDKRRLTYELQRQVDLTKEGWWSGELHVHRPVEAIELLMRAEDLHVAPVITWWNQRNLWTEKKLPEKPLVRFDGNRFYHLMAGEDEREGGALLYFNLAKPLAIAKATREYPSPMKFVEEARLLDDDVWIDIEKPFWIRRKGKPPPRGRKTPEEVPATELEELSVAIKSKKWHQILHYLRVCAPAFEPASLARERGIA
jgi:hypothetical protein